jgi:hypothetical protein
MSPELETYMKACGWYPGRRVDDEKVNEWLRVGVEDFGAHIFPGALRVFQEFGGLLIGTILIDLSDPTEPRREARSVTKINVSWISWEWQVNEVLFPIAIDLEDGLFHFALSASGRVYGAGTCNLFCGESFEEFLENIYLNLFGKWHLRSNWYIMEPDTLAKLNRKEISQMCEAIFGEE